MECKSNAVKSGTCFCQYWVTGSYPLPLSMLLYSLSRWTLGARCVMHSGICPSPPAVHSDPARLVGEEVSVLSAAPTDGG